MSHHQVNSIYHILDLAGSMGIPLEEMRFIVGRNTDEPRCFGIYEDTATGEFVVYKNKTDGTHVEHYRGNDEAYAAQQLWDKLESEVSNRKKAYGGAIAAGAPVQRDVYLGQKMEQEKQRTSSRPSSSRRRNLRRRRKKFNYETLIFIIVLVSCFAVAFAENKQKNSGLRNGYYTHRGDIYYQQSGNWYYYDNLLDDWEPYYDADDWYDEYDDYDDDYYGSYYTFDNEDSTFYSSEFYNSRSYDYDDDYDYYDYDDDDDYYDYDDYDDDDDWDSDWDSWDSWDTDWDSDW